MIDANHKEFCDMYAAMLIYAKCQKRCESPKDQVILHMYDLVKYAVNDAFKDGE